MKTKGWKIEAGAESGSRAFRLCAHPHNLKRGLQRQKAPALCSLLFALALSAPGQSYSIDWSKIAGGGGTSTGGVYSVSGTIGQPEAGGALTNGQYSVIGGFWVLPQAVQVSGAPTLTIARATPGQAMITWAPATAGFVLQENLNLGTTNWVNSPSVATNPIAVLAGSPAKFYRLYKP